MHQILTFVFIGLDQCLLGEFVLYLVKMYGQSIYSDGNGLECVGEILSARRNSSRRARLTGLLLVRNGSPPECSPDFGFSSVLRYLFLDSTIASSCAWPRFSSVESSQHGAVQQYCNFSIINTTEHPGTYFPLTGDGQL
jgi:hypothetical protein